MYDNRVEYYRIYGRVLILKFQRSVYDDICYGLGIPYVWACAVFVPGKSCWNGECRRRMVVNAVVVEKSISCYFSSIGNGVS
jgi:hypothetical protein